MEHPRLNGLTAAPGLFDKPTTHLEHEVGAPVRLDHATNAAHKAEIWS